MRVLRAVALSGLVLVTILLASSCKAKVEAGPTGGSVEVSAGSVRELGGSSGPKVASIELGDAYDEDGGTITHKTNVFTPSTEVIHVAAELEGVSPGATVKGTLYAVEVTDAQGSVITDYEALSKELEAAEEDFPVFFHFSIPDAGWPVGQYEVRLFVDDELIESVGATVEGTSAPPDAMASATPRVASVTVGDAFDEDTQTITHETTTFTPDSAMHFEVNVTGIPVGAEVSGTLVGVAIMSDEVGLAHDVEVDTQSVEAPVADFPVFFTFSMAEGWPTGEYALDVAVDGRVLRSIEIMVEESSG